MNKSFDLFDLRRFANELVLKRAPGHFIAGHLTVLVFDAYVGHLIVQTSSFQSNVQMVKCPNDQMSEWSNVRTVKCQTGQMSNRSNVQFV